MSSFEGEHHSLECTLSLSSTEELPRIRPSPLNSKEDDIPFRVTRRPHQVGSPSVLTLPPPLASSNTDLVGPSSTISTMTKMDALYL